MPTNEERREIAHSLRETSDAISDWGDSNPYWYVMKCVYGDVEIHNDNELLYRLADLIEPEPERIAKKIKHGKVHEFKQCYSCSKCSYGWHEDIYDKPFSYCPNCRAKLVD